MSKKDKVDVEFEEIVKMPPKSRRRYLLIPKEKIIQTIIAWRYPCEPKPFKWMACETLDFTMNGSRIVKLKITKEKLEHNCPCGKGCKPQKVRIIVEEV